MAKRKARTKRRGSKSKSKKKISRAKIRRYIKIFCLAAGIITALLIGFLEYTGRIDILVKLGLRDKPAEGEEVSVHFIDVGQGDCTLMLSGGYSMLIDSGEKEQSAAVIAYLKRKGIKTLDCIVITHPHTDHYGGMADIINVIGTKRIIMPRVDEEVTPTTAAYEGLLKTIQNNGLKIDAAKDERFTLGKAEVSIIASPYHGEDLNNYSALVKIENGSNSFLITGDCEKEEEQLLTESGADLSAKVLKVGHHGSSSGTSAQMLDAVLPRYAVISCGRDNSYGHPHDVTLSRLKKYADKIYRTDEDGTVVFISDGEGLTVELR